MPENTSLSLIDRAGLDRPNLDRLIRRGLSGSDDGELFLEYRQSEMLVFDNNRLKQATYDTSQGFGLRAVKGEAVGYAHSSDLSEPALQRAADAVSAVQRGYSGSYSAPPPRTNARLYGEENPLAESMGDDADLQDLGYPHMPGLERDSDDALTLPDDEGED